MLSVAVVMLALASDASACSCAAAPARQRLDSADAAFVGRLVDTRPAPDRGFGQELVYVFTVDHVVKGNLGARVEVVSPADAACGFELPRDEPSGILLRRDGEAWTGGLCGQIGPGELVTAAEEVDEPLVNWGGIVVGAAVLVIGALLLRRRLRRT